MRRQWGVFHDLPSVRCFTAYFEGVDNLDTPWRKLKMSSFRWPSKSKGLEIRPSKKLWGDNSSPHKNSMKPIVRNKKSRTRYFPNTAIHIIKYSCSANLYTRLKIYLINIISSATISKIVFEPSTVKNLYTFFILYLFHLEKTIHIRSWREGICCKRKNEF